MNAAVGKALDHIPEGVGAQNHTIDAVDAYASIVAQTSPDAAELIARISYSAAGSPPANHFGLPLTVMTAAAEHWFDCLVIWAAMRDRHLPCVLLEPTASVAGVN